LFIKRHVTS